jgi:hypothetical protein
VDRVSVVIDRCSINWAPSAVLVVVGLRIRPLSMNGNAGKAVVVLPMLAHMSGWRVV